MVKIIENATIIFKNGSKEFFDAISITENGIYTGHIGLKNNKFPRKTPTPLMRITGILSSLTIKLDCKKFPGIG